jgi:uncharacterized protein
MNQLTLTQIWIYPVKSLGGIPLQRAKVFGKGLQLDRRWMLIDEHGVFMTQRINPTMALFKLTLGDGVIDVTFFSPDSKAIDSISFTTDEQSNNTGTRFAAVVWNDPVEVKEPNVKISRWFSKHLQMNCKLVYFPESNPRAVDPNYKVNDEHVSLADAYPFLIIGQSSLDDLNSKLPEPLPMNRFRPNFVFTGGEPYEEDLWRNFSIGSNRFIGVKPCARCVLTTVNQATAEKGPEPLRTLSLYRKKDSKVLFGNNVVTVDEGDVRVGDVITLN